MRDLRQLHQVAQHGFVLIVQPLLVVGDVQKAPIQLLESPHEIFSALGAVQQRVTQRRPVQGTAPFSDQTLQRRTQLSAGGQLLRKPAHGGVTLPGDQRLIAQQTYEFVGIFL